MSSPISKDPTPKGPSEVSKHKKKPSEKVPPAEQDSTQQQSLIETGPFKGLPAPLQKTDYESPLPYVSCNEKGQDTTLTALTSNPSAISSERRVHLGFSVWFNFDLMAVTKPAYGIICDIDNKIMDIYQGMAESLSKSKNRDDFVNHFELFIDQNSEKLLGLPPEEARKYFNIKTELNRDGSWLAKEESFQVIKNLSQRGHLLFLNLDITDTQWFTRIRDWLDKNNLELDTLYASNIIDWIKDQLQQQKYVLNLKTVSTENTRFIQAYAHVPKKSKGSQQKQEPVQNIVRGTDNIKLPPKS